MFVCSSRSVRFFGFCRCWGEVGRFSEFFELNVPKAWQFFFHPLAKGLVVASANFVAVLLTSVSS